MTPRTAVLYARVSSREQREEGFSIEAQVKLLRAAAVKEGITIVQEFVEVESAKAAGRKLFNEWFLTSSTIALARSSWWKRPTGCIGTFEMP